MLKIEFVLQSTTLPGTKGTKVFSHHDIGICRDHIKDTFVIEAKRNTDLLFFTSKNIFKY